MSRRLLVLAAPNPFESASQLEKHEQSPNHHEDKHEKPQHNHEKNTNQHETIFYQSFP